METFLALEDVMRLTDEVPFKLRLQAIAAARHHIKMCIEDAAGRGRWFVDVCTADIEHFNEWLSGDDTPYNNYFNDILHELEDLGYTVRAPSANCHFLKITWKFY